jgi:hypothetical protein
MHRTRMNLRRFLVPALVLLMLCGIFAAEFPELLTLTDSSRNDFTLRGMNSSVSTPKHYAGTRARLTELALNAPFIDHPFEPLNPFIDTPLVSSQMVSSYFILRT